MNQVIAMLAFEEDVEIDLESLSNKIVTATGAITVQVGTVMSSEELVEDIRAQLKREEDASQN